MLLEWEHYEPDTWAAEADDFIFLIKGLEMDTEDLSDASFAYVFGTSESADVSGTVNSLSEAQAIANRYLWLVNNVTPERLDALIILL